MDNRPIGVFDSGVGGLTSVRELHRILPGEDIVYFGDTGRVPYGSRSKTTIKKYAKQDINYLRTFNVKAILAACGTVSSNLSDKDVEELALDIPFMGVVMPATRAACALSQEGRIGVMATTSTIRSGAYGKALRSIQPTARLIGNAAPLLVPLVENGLTDMENPVTRLMLQQYLEPFIREEVDTLILGCTHYPVLYDMINDMLGYRVNLVDSGAAAAREMQVMLCEQGLQANREQGTTVYRVTDTVDNFTAVAGNFLFKDIEASTEYVDVDIVASL
ncbi:glutamate racemase [Ruminococcaceae bacterium OttesenSCG-928-L11]|nr:glutamate racemase [Ruminococcaceae bacterium OttesenSCG-928-L11]